jgi:hypothetical protein
MATLNLSFNVPATHAVPLRSYLDSRYGAALTGMTDEQALEYHVVQSTVPGYKQWRRAFDAPVTAAKAAIEANDASRASATASDRATLASAQASAESAGDRAMTGLS